MNRQQWEWLNRELEAWQREGLVDAALAERLRGRYAAEAGRAARSPMLTVFGLMGALLVGLGLILLIAHNWGDLSRPVRTLIAFAPLLVAQGLAWLVVRGGEAAASWREAAATFWSLTIGATLALVAQTYHLPGDLSQFMLTWVLLGLPVVYLMNSAAVAALYTVGITSWVVNVSSLHQDPWLYWPLLLAILPWQLWRINRRPEAAGTVFAHWCTVIGFCVAVGFATGSFWQHGLVLVYAGAFASLYAIDSARAFPRRAGQRPGALLGGLGLLVLSVALTFHEVWRNIGFPAVVRDEPGAWLAGLVCLALLALPLVLTLLHRQRWAPHQVLLALMPVLIGVLASMTNRGWNEQPLGLLFNLYPLAVGVLALWHGARRDAMATINLGMLFVGTLIAVRFFDSDLGFTVRGVVFVLLGLAFLVTNVLMMRRRRSAS